MELDYRNDEIEIDLKEIIIVLFKKWWLIGAAAILCAGLVVIYGKFMTTPVYESTSSILVMNQRDEAGADGYLSQSLKLADDYVEVINSRTVVNKVINNLGLEETYEDIVGKITVNVPEETRILEIVVTDGEPEMAQKLSAELQKVSMAQIEELFEVYAVKAIDEANYPEEGISNFSMKKYAVLAFCGGAAIVVIVLVILFLLDGTIKTTDHVKQYIKVDALGEVSASKDNVEKYDVLKTNVKATCDALHTVVVTSSKEQEGAEQIAYSLAKAFAVNDTKVLYVDADLRNGKKTDKGCLASISDGSKPLQDICSETEVRNLVKIVAGTCDKPSALLDSKQFAEMLISAKEKYDFIVINTPALDTYIDAAIVAKQCDGTIVVVKEGKTNYQVVQKTMKQLAYVDAKILGCVINRK